MIHNVCPALHSNALEDGQHRQGNVVERGDSFVGSSPNMVFTFARVVLRARSAAGLRPADAGNEESVIDACKTDHHQNNQGKQSKYGTPLPSSP